MLAQANLRRSLGIAEQIGEASIMSVALGNLGMLSARIGDLTEAEFYYNQALQLAVQIHDPVYSSLWNGYMAVPSQDQGKLDEAKSSILKSLTIGRKNGSSFCIGFALIRLGHLRINQAIGIQERTGHNSGLTNQHNLSSIKLLYRARSSLLRGLTLEGLEAEIRTEGQLALAHVAFLLGEIDKAQQQVQMTIEEAQRHEQTWLLACALRLMGSIFSAREQFAKADAYFTHSLETLRECGMHLEEARTLHSYGESLLQRAHKDNHSDSYMQGLRYLQEARSIFDRCHAVLDLELVDRVLEAHATLATASKETRAGQQ